MNSEKVKEIKKALNTWKIVFHGITNADILTLINELESENERLKEQNGALSCDLDYANEKLTNAEIEVDDYKDRIAELEKENTNCLKQFAERLKEKMGVREYMGVKYKQGVFSENEIDETLKEFMGEEFDNEEEE